MLGEPLHWRILRGSPQRESVAGPEVHGAHQRQWISDQLGCGCSYGRYFHVPGAVRWRQSTAGPTEHDKSEPSRLRTLTRSTPRSVRPIIHVRLGRSPVPSPWICFLSSGSRSRSLLMSGPSRPETASTSCPENCCTSRTLRSSVMAGQDCVVLPAALEVLPGDDCKSNATPRGQNLTISGPGTLA